MQFIGNTKIAAGDFNFLPWYRYPHSSPRYVASVFAGYTEGDNGGIDPTHPVEGKIDYTWFGPIYCLRAEGSEFFNPFSDHHVQVTYKGIRGINC